MEVLVQFQTNPPPLILTSVFEAGHNHLRNNKDVVGLFITSKIKYVVVQIYVLFRKE